MINGNARHWSDRQSLFIRNTHNGGATEDLLAHLSLSSDLVTEAGAECQIDKTIA